jgi:hypothetical protein
MTQRERLRAAYCCLVKSWCGASILKYLTHAAMMLSHAVWLSSLPQVLVLPMLLDTGWLPGCMHAVQNTSTACSLNASPWQATG